MNINGDSVGMSLNTKPFRLAPIGNRPKIDGLVYHKDIIETSIANQNILNVNGKFYDIDLIVSGNEKIPAHCVILAASSEYFNRILTKHYGEKPPKEIQLKDLDYDVVKLVLKFMYTGQIKMSAQHVGKITEVAKLFQINSLLDLCTDFIMASISPFDCLTAYRFADHHDIRVLRDKVFEYACSNFECLNHKEIKYLSEAQLTTLIERYQQTEHTEEVVLDTLVAWLKHVPELRDNAGMLLLRKIYFPMLSLKYITELYGKLPETCHTLMLEWVNWHSMPGYRLHIANKYFRGECPPTRLIYITGFHTKNPLNVYFYNLLTDNCEEVMWSNWEPYRQYAGKTVVGDLLILAGGQEEDKVLNRVDSFDLVTYVWTALPPLLHARSHCYVVYVQGFLYAVGGLDDEGMSLEYLERYDFQSDKWEEMAHMPKGHMVLGAVVVDDLIYVVDKYCYFFDIYDPKTNTWDRMMHMNRRRRDISIVAFEHCIYTFGGKDKYGLRDAIECYDTKKRTWRVVNVMCTARKNISCFVLGNRIIACGGTVAKNQWSKVVDEYVPADNKTRRLMDVPIKDGEGIILVHASSPRY